MALFCVQYVRREYSDELGTSMVSWRRCPCIRQTDDVLPDSL